MAIMIGRACPHCGSPAWRNPCWYGVKNPDYPGDPPCIDWEYTEDAMARERRFGRNWFLVTACAVVVGVSLYFVM